MPCRWHIDECSVRWVSGWIDDDGPVENVDIAVNGQPVAAIAASDYRSDLEAAGLGDGRRAFSFEISEFLHQPSNLITVSRQGRILHSEIVGSSGATASLSCGLADTSRLNIMFIQTSDAKRYRPLLELTSRTVVEYCSRYGYNYQSFIGICRGYHPWQATYNRITLLKQILDSGFKGWACYLDADAFIVDLAFDLGGYLQRVPKAAFIAATDRTAEPDRPYWLVNAGVFFINLGHSIGRRIVNEWNEKFSAVTDLQLQNEADWSGVVDDQSMLQQILRDLPGASEVVVTVRGEPNLVNYGGGTFIRQITRAGGDIDARAAAIKEEVSRIDGLMKPEPLSTVGAASKSRPEADDQFVKAVYRVLLGREPDTAGMDMGTANLRDGNFDFESALRSCLASPEFQRRMPEFLHNYVQPTRLQRARSLTELANQYGSDKGTVHGDPPHRYTYLYDLLLAPYQSRKIIFLELGLSRGGPEVGGPIDRKDDSPSARMWLEYFPFAEVFGFDISDFSHLRHPRFTFVQGDAGVERDLVRLSAMAPGFDIVIDDASHASHHQQQAMRHLYPRLRAGGLYIIEDLHWQSPFYEDRSGTLPRTADLMIAYFERGEYMQNPILSESFLAEVRRTLQSFAWFPSFTGEASGPKVLILAKAPIVMERE